MYYVVGVTHAGHWKVMKNRDGTVRVFEYFFQAEDWLQKLPPTTDYEITYYKIVEAKKNIPVKE